MTGPGFDTRYCLFWNSCSKRFNCYHLTTPSYIYIYFSTGRTPLASLPLAQKICKVMIHLSTVSLSKVWGKLFWIGFFFQESVFSHFSFLNPLFLSFFYIFSLCQKCICKAMCFYLKQLARGPMLLYVICTCQTFELSELKNTAIFYLRRERLKQRPLSGH